MGYLYDTSFAGLVAFSVLAQFAAVPLVIAVGRTARIERTS